MSKKKYTTVWYYNEKAVEKIQEYLNSDGSSDSNVTPKGIGNSDDNIVRDTASEINEDNSGAFGSANVPPLININIF